MNELDPKDARIEEMIRGHLHETLDGHVGVASRRFAQHLASQPKAMAFSRLAQREAGRREGRKEDGPRFGSTWAIGLVGAALAATVTIFSLRPTAPMTTRTKSVQPHNDPTPRVSGSPKVIPASYNGERDMAFQTQDQGIVRLSDGTPARRYLQRRTDTIRGYDPRTKTRYEITQPTVEETIIVGLKQH